MECKDRQREREGGRQEEGEETPDNTGTRQRFCGGYVMSEVPASPGMVGKHFFATLRMCNYDPFVGQFVHSRPRVEITGKNRQCR